MNAFEAVIISSLLACAVTSLGIFMIARYERWGNRNSVYFMSFAAGVLVAVSFLHIIPKSFTMEESAPIFLLVGFMGLYLFNRFIKSFICHEYENPDLNYGLVPLLGIGFHSFLDGIIYSVTFNVSVFTGVLAAIGMVLHEFPEGIVTFILLQRGGFSRKKASLFAFLAAGISTPLGAMLSYPFIHKIQGSTLGLLLALSAGALVYVGASHLLPAVEQENKRFTILSLLSGILVALVIAFSKEGIGK